MEREQEGQKGKRETEDGEKVGGERERQMHEGRELRDR